VQAGARNSPGAESLRGAPKSPNNVTSTFFNAVRLLPKDLRFEHGDSKFDSYPRRLLTLLRPWVQRTRRKHQVQRQNGYLADVIIQLTELQTPRGNFGIFDFSTVRLGEHERNCFLMINGSEIGVL